MHNVLLIDDDQNILEVMKARLESNDYCVNTATEPEEALMKAKDKVFDLALVDLKLETLRSPGALVTNEKLFGKERAD
jgi:DNA-binding response OmpR family regulator